MSVVTLRFPVLTFALLAVALARDPVHAQSPPTVEIAGVDASENQLTAGLVVRDASGLPISDIQPGDIVVEIDGAVVPVTSLSTGQDVGLPIGIVLAIDTSGSMEGAYLAAARAGSISLRLTRTLRHASRRRTCQEKALYRSGSSTATTTGRARPRSS